VASIFGGTPEKKSRTGTDIDWSKMRKNKRPSTNLAMLEISYPQVIHVSGQKLVENTLFAQDRLML
jgi:hypothetical protein